MIRYGHYANVSHVADQLDVDALLKVIAEWERKLYDVEHRWTAADAHFVLRMMVQEEILRIESASYRTYFEMLTESVIDLDE